MLHIKNHKLIRKALLLKRTKVITGALLISLFFSQMLVGRLFHDDFFIMFMVTYIQLELFLWLGGRFFKDIGFSDEKPKQKIIWRLMLFYVTVLAIASVFFIAVFYFQFRLHNYGSDNFLSALLQIEISGFIIATLVGFALGALFFFYAQWSDALKREQKLAQEKLLFQYETLKSQVNPHFLFNSLNTLSSLVRSDPSLSEEFIYKFSGIYRYILENQENDFVPVSDELQFVHDYFLLQKIRDEEKIDLMLDVPDKDKLEVLPVSLQMLVENALKHNSATRNSPLRITIYQEGTDMLVVSNNLQPKTVMGSASGIGLKNLNQRCRLIMKREIEIINNSREYIVKVPVKIIMK